MKQDYRINLRLTDTQFQEVGRRAKFAGSPTTEYIRSLIKQDISTNTDDVLKRLARMIIFSSVSVRHLYKVIGHEGEMGAVQQEVERLLADLGFENGKN